MAVTLKDVAERAGVSRSAVSRTFTKGASVSEKTREKVRLAAHELGYQPNALASSLTTGRTGMIGLVSNNFHNPLFLEVFDLFTRTLQDRGLRPLLVNLSQEQDPDASVDMLRRYSVDGVVVASSTLPPSFSEAFHEAGIPVVHSFGRRAHAPKVPVVGIDNVACGRLAVETLVERGYRRIGFLAGPESATSTQDRLAGFRAAQAAHPDHIFTHSYAEAYSFGAGRREMFRLIEAGPAEAYFCGDDVISIGALSAIESSGLSVPGDIGLIGLNDMEMAGWDNIALTTIHQPIDKIVTSSVDLVVSLLKNPDQPPVARVFPCHLVERKTLRPIPVAKR